MKSINTICCGYCLHFHKKPKSGFTRTCGKGLKVNAFSNPCTDYKAKKYYWCPKEEAKVSSVNCIIHRSKGEHMNCSHFANIMKRRKRGKN